jgi:hypothetical protein
MSKVGSYWFCLIFLSEQVSVPPVSCRLAVCVSALLLLKSNTTLVPLTNNLLWSGCRVRAKFHLTKGIMTILDGLLKVEKRSVHTRGQCIY